MFLGNGMEIGGGEELRIAKKFYKLRCNVLMVSYRGCVNSQGLPRSMDAIFVRYGLSDGSPSEKGTFAAYYFTVLPLRPNFSKLFQVFAGTRKLL